MKIVIIGSTGQLGTALIEALALNHQVIGLTHNEIEVKEYNSLELLKTQKPDVIINTAAFHKTDICEEQPNETICVNTLGASNIQFISKKINAINIYISTDYVFDGAKKTPYTEEDKPSPINVYGISKYSAEQFTQQNKKHYIIRIASLFGKAGAKGKGGNFVETMITKAKQNQTITVIDDIYMSPTYSKDASQAIKQIIEKKLPYGIYHTTNKGYCSWYQFAKEIFRKTELQPNLVPIKSSQLNMKAQRPKFSALTSIKLPKYNINMSTWQQALSNYLKEKNHI